MYEKHFASFLVALVVASPANATEWDVSLWGKPRAFTEHVERLAQLVEERSGGEFALKLHYGGLANNRENLDGIASGQFEMAQFCVGYHAEKTPSLTVLELPFMGIETLEAERRTSMAIYNHQAIVDDLAQWNATLLMPTPLPQYNIAGSGEAPSTITDLIGLRVRAVGGIADALKSWE